MAIIQYLNLGVAINQLFVARIKLCWYNLSMAIRTVILKTASNDCAMQASAMYLYQ